MIMMTRAIVVVSLCLGLTTAVSGCGKKSDDSPEGLCKAMVSKRKESMLKMVKENIGKHESAFMSYCKTVPVDYLECDVEGFKSDGCIKILKTTKWQRKLNDVAASGKAPE